MLINPVCNLHFGVKYLFMETKPETNNAELKHSAPSCLCLVCYAQELSHVYVQLEFHRQR